MILLRQGCHMSVLIKLFFRGFGVLTPQIIKVLYFSLDCRGYSGKLALCVKFRSCSSLGEHFGFVPNITELQSIITCQSFPIYQ